MKYGFHFVAMVRHFIVHLKYNSLIFFFGFLLIRFYSLYIYIYIYIIYIMNKFEIYMFVL